MIDWIAVTQNPAVWIGIYISSELLIAKFILHKDLNSRPDELTTFSLALIPTGLFMSLQHLVAYGRLLDPAEIQAGQVCHGWAGLVLILFGLTATMYLSGKAPPTGASTSRTQIPYENRHRANENSPPQFAKPSLSGVRAGIRHRGLPHQWWYYDSEDPPIRYCPICKAAEEKQKPWGWRKMK